MALAVASHRQIWFLSHPNTFLTCLHPLLHCSPRACGYQDADICVREGHVPALEGRMANGRVLWTADLD